MRQNGLAEKPEDSEKGRRNGTGKAEFKNDAGGLTDTYEGAYDDDVRNGEGKYTWYFQPPPKGDEEEEGEEAADEEKPGPKAGDVIAFYQGQYKDNKKHGYGEFTYPAEDPVNAPTKVGMYQGHWEQDNRNGQGLYRYANGDFYEGSWKNGKKEGFGRYLFNKEEGTGYQGQFENNKPKGEGVWTLARRTATCR